MAAEVHYRFFQSDRLLGEGTVLAPFTVGRQTDASLTPPVSVLHLSPHSPDYEANADVVRKLVIVPISNRAIPRLSVKIDVEHGGDISARNLHRSVELQLSPNDVLLPSERRVLGRKAAIFFADQYQLQLVVPASELTDCDARQGTAQAAGAVPACSVNGFPPASDRPPASVRWSPSALVEKGQEFTAVGIAPPEFAGDDDHRSYVALDRQLKQSDQQSTRLLSMIARQEAVNHQELAVRLVRVALEAFKEPPGSKEFFDAAVWAAIQMIDLDRVAVLRKEHGKWICRTLSFRPGLDQTRAAAREFSQTLLTHMENNGRTTCIAPQADSHNLWKSIKEIDRAVAAPIFDEHKTIVGALYGDRLIGETDNHEPIGELEAALLEVIASGISSSLAVEQEQRLRSSMAQFFSPVVLEQLKHDPALLDGRVAEVSVLFCDIRGFSSVTERIGPAQAVEWINDVLTHLSQCVLAHDGVLVDYIGDELMAMWGAPGAQADHAQRACYAALDMLAQVGSLREKWKAICPEIFDLGIGINSGLASVGNTGSQQKFKYGPIGNTVNVASRVQGITKQIGTPGLITGHTATRLESSATFSLRRLAKVRVVSIAQPIDLFELRPAASNVIPTDLCLRYEQALLAYEAGDLKLAAGGLASLVQHYPDDRPTIVLLSRAVARLTEPDRNFDPVWNLTQK